MTNETFMLTLKCPSCGANLKISTDMDDFACGYCGTAQRVERRGGTVSLKLMGEALNRVQDTLVKTNAELAIRRLREQLADIEGERRQYQESQQQANGGMDIAVQISIIVTVLGFLAALGGYYFGESQFLFLGLLVGIFGVFMSYSIEAARKPEIQQREEFERELEKRLAVVRAEINEHLGSLGNQAS